MLLLTRPLDLIDCPGIVPPNMNDTPEDLLLRGVVRIENVEYPSHYIEALMGKVKRHHLERTYELKGWDGYMSFLEMLARKLGRLLKGGEPDVEGVAKIVVHDFLRGKIPWFTPCPTAGSSDGTVVEGREGKLGEMPKKRKRDGEESVGASVPSKDEEGSEREFDGFDSADEDEDESSDSQPDANDASDEDEVVDRISLGGSSDEESDSGGEDEDHDTEASGGLLSGGGDGSSEDGGAPVEPDNRAGRANKRRRK